MREEALVIRSTAEASNGEQDMDAQPPERRMPKQQRAVERRQALIESAALSFERVGFSDSTLSEIGQQAHSTTGAIYFYFRSKHELALAVIAEQNARTFDAMATGIGDPPSMEGLILASRMLADLLLTDPVVRAGIRLSLEQNSLANETADFYRQWVGSLEIAYRVMQSHGELREEVTPQIASRATVPIFTGIHLMSELMDGWSTLYEDLRNMWRIWIFGTISSTKQHDLLEATDVQFSGPQPALSRKISTNDTVI